MPNSPGWKKSANKLSLMSSASITSSRVSSKRKQNSRCSRINSEIYSLPVRNYLARLRMLSCPTYGPTKSSIKLTNMRRECNISSTLSSREVRLWSETPYCLRVP
jgi:hypothetical protein